MPTTKLNEKPSGVTLLPRPRPGSGSSSPTIKTGIDPDREH
jgi:hypothetical protein